MEEQETKQEKDKKVKEIKKELSEIEEIINNRWEKGIPRINYFNDMQDNNGILNNIKLLQILLHVKPYEFKNISQFLSDLRNIKNKLENNTFITPNTYRIPYGNNQISILSALIFDFIHSSDIDKNFISPLEKRIKKESFLGLDDNLRNSLEERIIQSKDKTKKLEEELALKELQAAKTEQENQKLELEKQQLQKEIEESKEERKRFELKIENLEEKQYQYIYETEKINQAIDKLKTPAQELIESKIIFGKNRKIYSILAIISFCFSGLFFLAVIINLICFVDINNMLKSEKTISLSFYLINIFPIIFPTILGFLFIRQSNINSQEVQKINRRFILIHEVNQSLQALVDVNRGKNMDNKTEKVIDKLIENILNYASESNSANGNTKDMNFIELNESIDKLIDTIDKKISLVKEQ